MQVKLSVRHGQLNETTQRFIREKVERLLHYFDRLTMIEVTVDLREEVDGKAVELLVNAEHKHDFVARDTGPELQAAMDGAVDKLVQQLRRYKEKIQDHRRTPSVGGGRGPNGQP